MSEMLDRVFPPEQCLPEEEIAAFNEAVLQRDLAEAYRYIETTVHGNSAAHCHVEDILIADRLPDPNAHFKSYRMAGFVAAFRAIRQRGIDGSYGVSSEIGSSEGVDERAA